MISVEEGFKPVLLKTHRNKHSGPIGPKTWNRGHAGFGTPQVGVGLKDRLGTTRMDWTVDTTAGESRTGEQAGLCWKGQVKPLK